jgi:lipoprotein-anchoring transpeptidase ErfK/SrfK
MSRKLLRALTVAVVLAVSAAVVLRATGGADVAQTALQTVPGTAGAAFTDVPVRDSVVVPAKPKRQIVDGVEVVVNIPSGRLELLQGDSLVKSYPVSVGSARYSTPVGDYLLATVIWNPWWNPPPGSAWAAKRKRTPPGPGNPMGRVKLHMDELIYIHGTTSEGRLGAPASHGCIRMSNTDVIDLARRLKRIADPAITDAELDRLARNDRKTRETVLARSVRMRVTYRVARVRGEKLHVYPDVYGRAGDFAAAVRAELARAGTDPSEVDAVAMRYLRDRAYSRGGASFALADLSTLRPPIPKLQLAEAAPAVAPVAEVPRPDTLAAPVAEATDTVAAAVPEP